MPTYEYACSSCGHQLEVKQRISEDSLTECPECKEHGLRKQLNNAGSFVLKGGGWYKDGYSSSKERQSESSSSGSSTGTDS
ncbi:FmdB family zinc ribbon protein [Thiohalorhabdus sp. Cl-TMA]|uniref:FmdB family zinc ribbon protein n=1 Tax=Thiohalorhabdus methylotrophus TaxID=3242694 RepID=A0ABV4TZ85_9GAMM